MEPFCGNVRKCRNGGLFISVSLLSGGVRHYPDRDHAGAAGGRAFFSQGRNTFIPWGWLFCSLLWGLPHLLTKNWETAVMSIVLSFVFELAYLAAGRKKWLSYAAVAVIFLM